MTKGLAYYTDSRLDPVIAQACRDHLQRAALGLTIASVALNTHLPFGWDDSGTNRVIDIKFTGERGNLTMFAQILAGLEALDTDVAFLVEHDVLYHPSHFAFTPTRKDVYFYNRNVWKVRSSDGHALHYPCSQTSGLCADRQLLVDHYRRRVELVEQSGFSRGMGFEPGTHNRAERVDDHVAMHWMSPFPNIDIRHDTNLTASRWSKEEFRNQQYTEGWTESDRVPGWGVTKARFAEFLADAHVREGMA